MSKRRRSERASSFDVSVPYLMKDVRRNSARARFTVVSTFAGGGGSSTGYRLAGGVVLAVNEFVELARETYSANYPDVAILPDDIRDISGKDILKAAGLKRGELDVLDGSPPCAAFSTLGKREKGWGQVKKYSDTKQRVDDLLFEFARVITEVQPKVFVAENVAGLTIGSAREVLGSKATNTLLMEDETVLSVLAAAGYHIDYKVLNAAFYGVPQNRERLFIIGVRRDLGAAPTFPRRTVRRPVTVGDVLEGAGLESTPRPPCKKGTKCYRLLSQAAEGQCFKEIDEKGGYYQYMRVQRDRPCPTIVQGTCSLFHWKQNRVLSIPEARRLMSFPDDYVLTGPPHKQWERLGRSVPPLLMKAIADNLYETVLREAK